eukprot:TRINITY_DN13492_c0_g1_i1.p1 TRINITY_DN13492_c0_g1~~TRINITY_DN13492_c0_g1_i1.p1  ORF type:complete len:349 (-),score=75.48 TRINITY_DN13492_c0_g1_i1:67-1113(-)
MRRASRLTRISYPHIISRQLFSRSYVVNNNVSVLSLPYSLGQPKKGVENGPKALIDAGLLDQIKGINPDYVVHHNEIIVDYDNLPSSLKNKKDHPKAIDSVRLGYVNQKISEASHKASSQKNFCLSIGGDHSLAVGTISGLLKTYPELCIVWVDAHADINTPETSPSGNIHGMPISFLMQLKGSGKIVPGFEWLDEKEYPVLDTSRIVYIGLRDVDSGERKILKDLGITAYDAQQLDSLGIKEIMDRTLQHFQKVNGTSKPIPLHLSFDIDGLDPTYAPATGTVVPFGLTLREGRYVAQTLAQISAPYNFVSMDLFEVNPSLSDSQGVDKTVQSGVALVKAGLGETLL